MCFAITGLSLALARAPCRADVQRVGVIADGDALARALGTALRSWGVVVFPISAASIDEASQVAVADALVMQTLEGDTLHLELRVVAPASAQRWQLPGGPVRDPESAAAVALSIKARLRNTSVAPKAQRAPIEAVQPVEMPSPPAPVSEPESESEPSHPPPPAAPGPLAIGRLPERAPSVFTAPLLRLEVGVGASSGLVRAAAVPAHFEGSVSLMRAFGRRAQLGLRLGAAGPSRTALRSSGTRAALREVAFHAGLRGMVSLDSRLALDFDARAGLSQTRISGSRAATDERFETTRQSPTFGASVGLQVVLGAGWYLVPCVIVDGRLRRQRYFVGVEPAWELQRTAVTGALRLGVGLL